MEFVQNTKDKWIRINNAVLVDEIYSYKRIIILKNENVWKNNSMIL